MVEWTNTKPLDDLAHELEIHYPLVYARAIEYGAPPHPVSEQGVQNIERWASIKVRQEYTTKDGKPRKRKLKENEARELAEAIAWKIRKEGSEPKPWLRPAVDDAQSKADKLMKRGIQNGKGSREIADYIVTRAQENIDKKGLHYTGKMGQTLTITDLTTGEVLESRG